MSYFVHEWDGTRYRTIANTARRKDAMLIFESVKRGYVTRLGSIISDRGM